MRIRELDFLRGLAILLVLFRHGHTQHILHHAGWIGVDLFFVLSGFLVSGILFKEYKTYSSIDVKRFFIRRAFRIYPSFYVLIIITIIAKYIKSGQGYDEHLILSEIFYLQSYLPGIWSHTWSLAIEEHFYLGLAFFMLIAVRLNIVGHRAVFITIMIALIVLFTGLRFYEAYQHRLLEFYPFFQTHLRIDGILLGMFFSYLHHFTGFFKWIKRYGKPLSVLSMLFIIPAFIFDGDAFFMNTMGITMLNIGFALILLLAIRRDRFFYFFNLPVLSQFFRIVSFIGVHSYGIYLWHLFVQRGLNNILVDGYNDVFFILLSLIGGAALSFLIEKPFLKVRDRYFIPPVRHLVQR